MSPIPETYLQELFVSGLLNGRSYFTTNGLPVMIRQIGSLNPTNGPDIINCTVEINGNPEKGHIEIHYDGMDWFRHHHHRDAGYINCRLHVCFELENKGQVFTCLNREIPTIVMSDSMSLDEIVELCTVVRQFKFEKRLPCGNQLSQLSKNFLDAVIHQEALVFLDKKIQRYHQLRGSLEKNGPYHSGKRYLWDQLLLDGFFRALGYSLNKEQFEYLSHKRPLLDWMEFQPLNEGAIYAELVRIATGKVISDLEKENITSLLGENGWNTRSVRWCNQPENRLWIAASLILIGVHTGFIKPILNLIEPQLAMGVAATDIFRALSEWLKTSQVPSTIPQLGKQRRESMVINTVLPVLFAYGDVSNRKDIKKMVLDMIETVSHHQEIHLEREMAGELFNNGHYIYHHLGLLHLYEHGCSQRQCLDCPIGMELLRN